MNEIEKHYNKFNEDKRLKSRHGQVEHSVTSTYIQKYLFEVEKKTNTRDKSTIKILDIGAGCGAYTIPLFNEGYDVTAVEYVKYNLGILKKNCPDVKAYQGDARKLKRFEDNTFDMALLFGPMYHLFSYEEKLMALNEAKRVVKPGGYILVAYLMNEYAVLTYAFKEHHYLEIKKEDRLTTDFHTISSEKDLYDYVRLDDICRLSDDAGLTRAQIIAPDGAADYMRSSLNEMSDEEFFGFIQYQLSICDRPELLGASSHTLDILVKA